MTTLSGQPLAAFDAFAKNMITGGLIQSILSVMGFAMVMKVTECDKHLVNLLGNGLKKAGVLLIPCAVLGTFAVNIALPSAAGTSAAVGAIFIPILISAGIHPVAAAAAVFGGTMGSHLNPGVAHNAIVAKIANVELMDVVRVHAPADFASAIISAIAITIVIKVLKEDKAYDKDPNKPTNGEEIFKINLLYALMPVIPIVIVVLGGTSLIPFLKKIGIVHAMLFGCILSTLVTRKNPAVISKAFFDGMGSAYANILGIIIAAGVFVSGLQSIGIVDGGVAKRFLEIVSDASFFRYKKGINIQNSLMRYH